LKTLPKSLSHYQAHLKVIPDEQFIEAEVTLTFRAPINGMDSAIFYLHKQLEVKSLTGDHLVDYCFDTKTPSPIQFMPEAGTLHLGFAKPLEKGEIIRLRFEFGGKVTMWPEWSANVISETWTELGMYLPWFPFNGDYGDFTFSVDVECDVAYQVRSYGEHVKHGDMWHFVWDHPTNDIIIVISKNIKSQTIEAEHCLLNVHHVTLRDSTASMIGKDLSWILACFDSWFLGEKRKEVSLIESPIQLGGGYSSRGLIVLGGLNDQKYVDHRQAYIRYLSHEAAHLWWWAAETSSWEDWLNESFAEYSALLAVKEMFGQDPFEKMLAEKSKAMLGSSPIWGLERNDYSTKEKMQEIETVLYSRGPVLLHRLSTKIGQENFLVLCQEMISQNAKSTVQFLEVIGRLEGENAKHWMESTLKAGA
jgi:hypothetical protein